MEAMWEQLQHQKVAQRHVPCDLRQQQRQPVVTEAERGGLLLERGPVLLVVAADDAASAQHSAKHEAVVLLRHLSKCFPSAVGTSGCICWCQLLCLVADCQVCTSRSKAAVYIGA